MGERGSGVTLGRANPVRILIVEDNPKDAELLQWMLRSAKGGNFELRCVGYLAQAIELILSSWPEVLLLDLTLPDSSGVETIERARAAGPDLPIVVLTGRRQDELMDH